MPLPVRRARPAMPEPIVLATDLDGTFLGGSDADRAALYAWLCAQRDAVVLVFVSGRGQEFMRALADTLPVRPDHCIGDVGTSVHSGAQLRPLRPVEDWIQSCWPEDAAARIDAEMQRHPQLRAQPQVGGRRRSYLFDDARDVEPAAARLQAMGFDTLRSDNLYFDVLPRGVQKGPTLLRTLDALGLPRARTLVAGDTLNDLSMFETGLAGVAVGNREPELDRALAACPHVLRSPLAGAAGVLDALVRFQQLQGDLHGFVAGHRLPPPTV